MISTWTLYAKRTPQSQDRTVTTVQGHLSSFFYTFLQETPSLLFIYRMTVTLRKMSPVCDVFSPVMFLKPNIFFPCWQVMGAVYFLEGKKPFFSTWWPNLFERTSHFGSFSASLHSLSWQSKRWKVQKAKSLLNENTLQQFLTNFPTFDAAKK